MRMAVLTLRGPIARRMAVQAPRTLNDLARFNEQRDGPLLLIGDGGEIADRPERAAAFRLRRRQTDARSKDHQACSKRCRYRAHVRSPLCFQPIGIERWLAQPHTRCRVNCIEHRGNQRRGSRLANAARRFTALDDVDVDQGHVVDVRGTIVVKIALLDASVLEGDLIE